MLSEMTVDGVTQGFLNTGLEVLPGAHRVDVAFEIIEKNCAGEQHCFEVLHHGRCAAQLRTEAGEEYAVRVEGSAHGAHIFLQRASPDEPTAGSGNCVIKDYTIRSDSDFDRRERTRRRD